MLNNSNKILVHICCAPCMTHPFVKLIEDGFEPVGFFFNPNIHPVEEYEKRLEELKRFAKDKYDVVYRDYPVDDWFLAIKGLEQEKEGGKRCEVCFRVRLEETVKYAKENGFGAFTTVLSISPHKNAELINKIGKELEQEYSVKFLEANFKKQDGFKKSILLSKKYNLFRQNYCGCIYSIR